MEDTICAIATSLGIGAISIIRLSGKDAISIVDSIFSSDLKKLNTHTIQYGHIKYNDDIIDEVLVMIMKGPKTYTTEDVVEINCHGGYSTTNKILEILLNKGCRLAEPGEFTKRAFLNGRINLLESEAVNELINSKTESKRKLSLNLIGGNLTRRINSLREELLALMANIEVNIDYPEYTDNLEITQEILKDRLDIISVQLDKLVEGANFGKIVSNGINVALVGKPNVGKSSVLNHLLDEQKAIVTNVAGTTRDLVEGQMSLNGIEIKLIDTAGIHKTNDIVEKIGVEKSINIMESSDVNLLIIDGSKPLDNDDKKLLDSINLKKTIILVNKNDILIKQPELESYENVIYGNTIDPNGLDELKIKLIEMFKINDINKDLTYLSNARQTQLVNDANNSIKNAKTSIKAGLPIDMIESDLKECYDSLGKIIGDTYEEALIDRLFSDFCVGK